MYNEILAPLITFVSHHILVLVITYGVILLVGSNLPPLPPGSGFYKTWMYSILHSLALDLRQGLKLFPGFSKIKFDNGQTTTTEGSTTAKDKPDA